MTGSVTVSIFGKQALNEACSLRVMPEFAARFLKGEYVILKSLAEAEGKQLQSNAVKDKSGAYLVRTLDCAVLEHLHQMRRDAGLPQYDTLIGAPWEGKDLYEDAGITDKNHMQICVRTEVCIRGYFRVRELEGIDLLRWDNHPHRGHT